MKTFAARSRIITVLLLVGSASSGLLAAELTLQKVPTLTVEQTQAYPVNLASHDLGARLQATSNSASLDQKATQSALLSGDPAADYRLSPGTSSFLVSLAKIENVGRIAFTSRNAKGKVTIATASAKLPADSPQWQTVLEQELSTSEIQAKLGASEAKYVRLTFDVTEPGEIAGFGIYATPRVSDFTAPRSRKATANDESISLGLVSYNHTNMHAKARALYVSSGADLKQANNMIDDQAGTTYSFAAEDGTPTTVIDLGARRTLRRLSAIYSPRAGKMDFYVLQTLAGANSAPSAESAPATVTFNDASFTAMEAVGSVNDDGTQGRAAIDFPATTGRYVMVRWTPTIQQDSAFSLAEIAALGGSGQRNMLLAANAATAAADPDEAQSDAQSSDGKTMLDGKTMIDAKDMPGEGPAEAAPASPGEGPPPSLPQPPPFTFVPVQVPVSP